MPTRTAPSGRPRSGGCASSPGWRADFRFLAYPRGRLNVARGRCPMTMPSMSSWTMLRSIRDTERVKQHRINRGTVKRILSFARPYRREIVVFLLTVVLDAVIGVATPVLAGHVVNAITGGGSHAATQIIRLALLIAGLAVVDAFLSLAQR